MDPNRRGIEEEVKTISWGVEEEMFVSSRHISYPIRSFSFLFSHLYP